MRICIVGKYPPIQGGVSARTYHYAHALAARGHQVHVVTNAKEVKAPYRMYMRPEDWDRCEGDYGEGYVRVHWTEAANRRQFHIPMSAAFVSKLAGLAGAVCTEHDLEIVFSFYMEPYGIAGHLAAEMAGLPHVVKTAGSDAGRLWGHPQFKALYDHVFRKADAIFAGGKVVEMLQEIGIDKQRLWPDFGYTISEPLFTPEGPALDVESLCAEAARADGFHHLVSGSMRPDIPYLGVYGKLGESKGTYALLEALAALIGRGHDVGLLVMGHERPRGSQRFRAYVSDLGLQDHVVQIPFLPNWRVPEFIRRCRIVCCLEQDFPITFHAPIMPREVLACGACLVGATEIMGKLPFAERMIDGYNCVAIQDVNDHENLAKRLAEIFDDRDGVEIVGARGHEYVLEAQADMPFPKPLEDALNWAIDAHDGKIQLSQDQAREEPASDGQGDDNDLTTMSLTERALNSLTPAQRSECLADEGPPQQSLKWKKHVLDWLHARSASGDAELTLLAEAVRFDLRILEAMNDGVERERLDGNGGMFRANTPGWVLRSEEIPELVPHPMPGLIIETFDCDVPELIAAATTGATLPASSFESYQVAIVPDSGGSSPRILVLDDRTAEILRNCDGTLSVAEIARRLPFQAPSEKEAKLTTSARIETLLQRGLIGLREVETGT